MPFSDDDITTTESGPMGRDRAADARPAPGEDDKDVYHRSAEGPMDGGADPHGTDGGADGGAA